MKKFRAAVVTTAIAMFGGFCAATVVTFNRPGFSLREAKSRKEWFDTSIVTAILFGAALWAPSMRPRDPFEKTRFEDLPEELQKPVVVKAVQVPRAGGEVGAPQASGEVKGEWPLPYRSPDEQKGDK